MSTLRLNRIITVAILSIYEECAKIADEIAAAHVKGSPVSSMAEDTWGASGAKEVAAAIRKRAKGG